MSGNDPTGNIADLANNLFGVNSQALNTFSSLIGALADVAGAAEAVIAVVNLFIGQPDPLQPILDALQKDFTQLYANLEARQNEEDWRDLAKEISAAESVLEILDGLLASQPPLTDEQRLSYIATCLTPLNALGDPGPHPPSPFFLAVYSEQVYWTDAGRFLQPRFAHPLDDKEGKQWGQVGSVDTGYGTQAPPVPPDDQVFFYLYVLPYYLKAAFILTAVGTSFFADFGKTKQHQQEAVISVASFLTSIHDLIAGGITQLSPEPGPWPISPESTVREGDSKGGPGYGWVVGITGEFSGLPHKPKLSGISVEWGAVEKFSGVSSIRWIGLGSIFSFEWVFQKIQVRVLREKMNVYTALGLPKLWNVINSLNILAGQQPLPRHKYNGWSFREILAEAGVGAGSGGFFHLSDMAKLIRDNAPHDTSQTGTFSWRDLLEPSLP